MVTHEFDVALGRVSVRCNGSSLMRLLVGKMVKETGWPAATVIRYLQATHRITQSPSGPVVHGRYPRKPAKPAAA